MIGLIGSGEPEREGRFVKNFGATLFECLLEVGELGELIPYALILFVFGFVAYLVGTMVFHLIFDPKCRRCSVQT